MLDDAPARACARTMPLQLFFRRRGNHGHDAMKWKDLFWPVVGLAAVAVSIWLLYQELRGISLDDVWDGLAAIPARGWVLSALVRGPPIWRLPATTT
jgi:hypothetical protein